MTVIEKQNVDKEALQRSKVPVFGSYSSNTSANYTFSVLQRELLFSNDYTEDMTIQIKNDDVDLDLSFTIKAGEVFDERLPEFNKLIITATGVWRAWVRSARLI